MDDSDNRSNIFHVSVREIFYQKNPKMARHLPGFLFRYLEKIVHEEYINDLLTRYGQKTGIDFINCVIEDFKVTTEVTGTENIPAEGRYIFVSNHPLGGFDGLLLISVLSRYCGPKIRFLVNDILMNIKNLTPLFIPINKHGAQSKDAAFDLDKAFESDLQILTFPAGLVSRKIKGRIIDLDWQKNFITKAIKYKRDIVPAFFTGRNTDFFYNLSNFRKFLGIKWNIEMLYLADETYRHRNEHIRIYFGKPIPYLLFDNSKSHQEWAYEVKKIVYQLGNISV